MSPPPSPSGDARRATLGLGALIGVLALLRLIAAGSIPLTEDEAYYRLWAQHLRLGYFDHPPMTAWWIWCGTKIAGDTALGVRLLPVIASLATTLLVFDLGQKLGTAGRAGLTAAILYNATLTVGAGAILAVPDTAASLFWVIALWALARARAQAAFWLCAGAAAGLACLSKYSALFLAPGVLLWLALTPQGRRSLLTPWPWLAAAVAAALFGLNVAWNAQHHWLTFAKQFGRVSPGRLAPRYLIEFLAAQFVLLNPAVAVLAGAGAIRAWRGGDPIGRLALAATVPFFAYLLLHSLHDRVQAHWPVPLYPGLALLAALAAQDAQGWRRVLVRLAPIGVALSALALGDMALARSPLRGGDPADPLRGWPAFAAQVEGLRAAHGGAWIGTVSYGLNAQLQAQHASRAPVLQLNESERYDDMPQAPADLGRPGLIVDLARRIDLARLKACFIGVGTPIPVARGASAGAESRYLAVPVQSAAPSRDKRRCLP
jgi:4-amino-4-deoxy-L-arabinose transferase-like glycosyltransferase